MGSNAEAEVHAQRLKEKAAREMLRGITINSWPHDENGVPMAIAIGAASDLVPTVQWGNVCIGPATIMRPVSNDPNRLVEELAFVQDLTQYVVGTRRRLLTWALDPNSRIAHPVTGQVFNPSDVAKTHPDEVHAIVAEAQSQQVGATPSAGGEHAAGQPAQPAPANGSSGVTVD